MAELEIENFDIWLNKKLSEFQADESVFGNYIKGILEGEENFDEKKEALDSIIAEITENDTSTLSQEILEKWEALISKTMRKAEKDQEGMDVKLARLMEEQAKTSTVRSNTYTAEEKRIREAILKQYGQCSDDEGEDGASACANTASNGLEKNTNAALVAQAEREKREQSKLDSQKKKEKDKEDREKQKQVQADKKEKRKTQKGERRR